MELGRIAVDWMKAGASDGCGASWAMPDDRAGASDRTAGSWLAHVMGVSCWFVVTDRMGRIEGQWRRAVAGVGWADNHGDRFGLERLGITLPAWLGR
ncbi:hypothetical protein ACLOJK_000426 [Asimina triloba]